ncbi:hypothetical protein Ae201684_019156, partial [Aphanomyces euteiches]
MKEDVFMQALSPSIDQNAECASSLGILRSSEVCLTFQGLLLHRTKLASFGQVVQISAICIDPPSILGDSSGRTSVWFDLVVGVRNPILAASLAVF